ncbi:glycine oxidase-like [Ylistrum balloti]|uniref:glycine oxidase-like n=1 Tax=Ylistrum balloti TaxID=509963 RepID=UPI002905C278|nr:glycine oxidase-like [Ylistrum balloti]
MGLSTAFEIACNFTKPEKILLVDEGYFVNSASYNAAGVLATQGAQFFLSPLRKQIVTSTRSYPQWLQKLSKVVGAKEKVDDLFEYSSVDDYYIYNLNDEAEKAVYDKRCRRLKRENANDGIFIEGIPDCLKAMGLNTEKDCSYYQTIYFQNHHTISSKKLLDCLLVAVEKLGVKIAHSSVIDIDRKGQLKLISTNGEEQFIHGKQIILTGGNRTKKLLEKLSYSHRLKSLQGLLLVLEAFDSLKNITNQNKEIMTHLPNKRYLVQKDNSIFYGSINIPVEEDYYEESVQKKYQDILLKEIEELFPSQTIKIKRTQGGHRPYNVDKLPLFGFLTENIWINTAHYKSGLALAPLHAGKMAEMFFKNLESVERKSELKESLFEGDWKEFYPLYPIRKRGLKLFS